MARVEHTCTGCVPIDASIIDVYVTLVETNKAVTNAEAGRVTAEGERVAAETERTATFTDDHGRAVSDHSIAQQDHALAGTDHSASVAATASANAAAALANLKAELVQQRLDTADADHTRAVGDHNTAVSDHSTASSDHTRAVGDHNTAVSDHSTASSDHTTAQSDHTTAGADHNRAETDHSTAASDHTASSTATAAATAAAALATEKAALVQDKLDRADTDHTRAESDHATAASDHTTAASDHTQAGADHTLAASDHTTAGEDHDQAVADHTVMSGYDSRLGAVENEVTELEAKVGNLSLNESTEPGTASSYWKNNSGVIGYGASGMGIHRVPMIDVSNAWKVHLETEVGSAGVDLAFWADASGNVLANIPKTVTATDFVVPDGAKQLYVNYKTNYSCTVYGIQDKLDELRASFQSSYNNYFTGNGNTLAKVKIVGLIPGERYRLYLDNPTPDMSGVTVTSTARLVVYNYYNNATTGNLVFVAIGSSLARFYEFTVPSNSDYVEVCGRVAIGYKFRFLLTKLFYENTVSFSKSDSLTSGTAKTISIPVVGYSGQRIMASITGQDGILKTTKLSFFKDRANNVYLPPVSYGDSVDAILTGDTTYIDCSIPGDVIMSSGTVTVTIDVLGTQEQLNELFAKSADLRSELDVAKGELYEIQNGVAYTEVVSLSQGVAGHKDINGSFKKGARFFVSIVGNAGVLASGIKSYLIDVANNKYYPAFEYNTVVEFTVIEDSTKLRFLFGDTSVLATDSVTVNIIVLPIASQVYEGQTTIDKIAESLFPVPDYYNTDNYLRNKIDRINGLAKNAVGNGDAFIFITDEHWSQNAKKSPNLVRYIAEQTNIYNIFSGGDTGGEQFCKTILAGWGRKIHHAVGNHEFDGGATNSQLYYMFSMQNNDEVGEPQKLYYYYDNIQAKIRYIFLVSDGSNGYSNEQLSWFTQNALNVESGWGIVIITHWLAQMDWVTNAAYLPQGGKALQFVNAIQNYSGNGEIIAVLQGHWHRDRIVTRMTSGQPIILTACDKYVASTATEDGVQVQDIDVTRTSGTITEQAFDVVIVNRSTKTINLVRIGGLARDGINDNAGSEVEERVATWGE